MAKTAIGAAPPDRDMARVRRPRGGAGRSRDCASAELRRCAFGERRL